MHVETHRIRTGRPIPSGPPGQAVVSSIRAPRIEASMPHGPGSHLPEQMGERCADLQHSLAVLELDLLAPAMVANVSPRWHSR